jgi:4-carboxymuconolactone decarboxylase
MNPPSDQVMTRYSTIDPEKMSPEQRRVRDEVIAGPRGRMVPPVEIWLRSPELAAALHKVGEHCRFRSALPPRLAEVAILATARRWTAQFEWWAHAQLAREAGIEEPVIEAIRTGVEPPLADDDQRLVYRFARAMLEHGRVDDALFAQAKERLGERGLVDLVGILGYYALVSFTLNAFEVPVPDGTLPLDPGR